MQVLRLREDAQAGGRVHAHRRRARRGRGRAVRALAVHGDPLRQRREPARRPRVLRRGAAQAEGGAAGRPPQVLHGLRDPPHGEARGLLARGGPARAQGRGPRLAPRRRRRDLRRPRARPDRARQGAPRRVVRRPRHRAPDGDPDALHAPLRARRDLRGARRPPAPPARPAGRDGRLPRLHPARVPSREHGLRAARLQVHDRRRRPEDGRGLAPAARQHPEHQGVLDHDGPADGPDRAPLRRERRPGHRRPRADLPGRGRRRAAPSRRSPSSCATIQEAGRVPVQRDTLYNEVRRWEAAA